MPVNLNDPAAVNAARINRLPSALRDTGISWQDYRDLQGQSKHLPAASSAYQPGLTPRRNIYADLLGFGNEPALQPSVLTSYKNPYGNSALPFIGPGSQDVGSPTYFQPIIAAHDVAAQSLNDLLNQPSPGDNQAISDYAAKVGGPLLSHEAAVAQSSQGAFSRLSDLQQKLRLLNLMDQLRGQGAEMFATQKGLKASAQARAGQRALKALSPLPEVLGGIAGYFGAGGSDQSIREAYASSHTK